MKSRESRLFLLETGVLILVGALMFILPAGALQVIFWAGLILMFLKVAGESH